MEIDCNISENISFLDDKTTLGLGAMKFFQPPGTFALTPASFILIRAIIENKSFFSGIGIDWGSGVGCLTIIGAKINLVSRIYGLEILSENVKVANENAKINRVSDKVTFMLSDSYIPLAVEDRCELEQIHGKVNFIISNPPSSEGDDGFGFRRVVLNGAKEFLVNGGLILLNISYQYGPLRIEHLYKNIEGFSYGGIVASTEWVPFDLNRPDLLECLKLYAKEERKGGLEYTFYDNKGNQGYLNAEAALDCFEKTGQSPLTEWQTHLFKYRA
jgi:hypothetical protein